MNLCHKSHEIVIFNESEKLLCPLYLLKGSITKPCSFAKITISSENPIEFSSSFCHTTGRFKVIVGDLVEQEYNLSISYCNAVKKFTLRRESPQSIRYTVKVLYIICKDHDGCFQSPNTTENTVSDACARATVGIKLVQSLFSDKLQEQGFGRKTFHLTSTCVPFYSKLPVDEAKRMDENSLWNYFAREIISTENQSSTSAHTKYVGFIGCTEYLGISDNNYVHENFKARTVGNAALGGGDFALFGTGCLYTWPKSITDVMSCFENTQAVDARNFLDDSNGRKTFGGCFATTLGSVCHEIGHIFDLGHTQGGIMGNGLDFINRVFMVTTKTEALPNRVTRKVQMNSNMTSDPRLTKLKHTNKFLNLFHDQKGKDLTYFERNSAITLAYHKWFNQHFEMSCGEIICTKKGETRVITSKRHPLRLVEFRDEDSGSMISHYSFLNESVLDFTIPETMSDVSCVAFVIDDRGNIFTF